MTPLCEDIRCNSGDFDPIGCQINNSPNALPVEKKINK